MFIVTVKLPSAHAVLKWIHELAFGPVLDYRTAQLQRPAAKGFIQKGDKQGTVLAFIRKQISLITENPYI